MPLQDPPPSPMAQRLAFLLSTTFRQLRQVYARRLEPHHLTPPQLGALMSICHHPSLKLSEIARLAGGDAPTLCRIVDRLQSKGLVQRSQDESDRRCLIMQLTRKGARLARACQTISDEIETTLLSSFDEHEQETLRELLGRLLVNAMTLNSQDEAPP